MPVPPNPPVSPPPAPAQPPAAEAAQRMEALSGKTAEKHLAWAEAALTEGMADQKTQLQLLILRAHALRELGTSASLSLAVTGYNEALTLFRQIEQSPSSPALIHQNASLWMKRGICLLTLGDTAALHEAILSFEQAIALRRDMDLRIPWNRWVLCAGWMNKADALTKLGTAENFSAALALYDLAISHLQLLPLTEDRRFRWRLAVAWQNRGLTLLQSDRNEARERALNCFDNCLSLLQVLDDAMHSDDRRTRAAALCNRANILCERSDWAKALEAATAAAELARPMEQEDLLLAEVAMKSRHLICKALAGLLEAPAVDAALADEWILQATDAVEQALALARHWESRGDSQFRSLLEEMFHFGARIYRAFQPHFLGEYLMEGSGSVFTATMQSAAKEALDQAAAQIHAAGIAQLKWQRFERLVETLAKLQQAAEVIDSTSPTA